MTRLGLLCLLALVGCGGTDPVPVTPGELAIQLTAPNTPPGAMVLTVSGGPISGLTPANGIEGALSTDADGTHLLLVGSLDGGVVAVLQIPDVALATRYVIRIDQVADATTFALLDAAQWRASLVTRP
ncbi:MAG: hypothetical protein SFU84_01770 [Gemmatimonadales bacterium]|nr:hypothetical protein [Gemmatimonadales bacterium]